MWICHELADEYLILREGESVTRRELVILQVGRAGGIGKRGEAFTFINNENKGLRDEQHLSRKQCY